MSDGTAELLRESKLYIDGRWTAGGGDDLEVDNPATGEITGAITQASTEDVEVAIAAAKAAFPSWAATSVAVNPRSWVVVSAAIWVVWRAPS